jgi:zeta-carotene desaturase
LSQHHKPARQLTVIFCYFLLFLHLAAYALGFLDCKDISARCMLTIFQFFATKTDASVLRMLNGSPAERLLKPITDYIEAKGGRIHLRYGCK